ncbi:MAG: TVP38/TMEM64 family protein [Acidobacteria bacterium]|nr:TVP38/TMEM64 family protein [Acidobacteriota bacterium]
MKRLRFALPFAIFGVFGLVALVSAGARDQVSHAAEILATGNTDALRDYILSFGAWAPIVSTVLMLFQALAAPLPAFVLAFVNGLAFGLWWGGLLTMGSATLAAAVSFGIGRGLGRPVAEGMVGEVALARADRFFARWGAWAVLIARLTPIVSFDVISYAAGLTRIRIVPFLGATIVGMAPATFIYTYLGHRTPGHLPCLLLASGVITVLLAIVMWRRYVGRRTPPRTAEERRKETASEP